MIVVDASAAIAGLLNDGPARAALSSDELHAPHLIDAEVASGLRRHVAAGLLSATLWANPKPDFSGDFHPASREIKQERRST